MGQVSEFNMKLAGREWSRQFYTAVVRSFAKTLTEPVTNSDTSYKRKYSLPDASGLVEKALSFKKGMKFDLSQAKEELSRSTPGRVVEIHLFTARGHGHQSRTCQIIDFAEGLSPNELESVFKELAADKSEASKGRPGRSLFGRGVSDVLLGHTSGVFYSYHDHTFSKAEFSFDPKKDKEPKVKLSTSQNVSLADLKGIGLRRGENGSCVQFVLHEDCHIPEEGTIIPILSQFYMLRLINADPNVMVKVFRHRSGGKTFEDTLDYDFPIGDVVERFSFTIQHPVPPASLPALQVDAIICRADAKGGLPGVDAGQQRANGLLIVDDKDAVLDLTFLPQFEGAPYLTNIFGIVRIQNLREIFSWFLNNGKDSPLTVTRDGLDPKHEFTKLLFKELGSRLEPIYKKEEERFNKAFSSDISSEAKERINEALKQLNKFLREIGEGGGDDEEEKIRKPDALKTLQFLPAETVPTIGRPRLVRLYLKKDHANLKGTIIYDTSNRKIEFSPLSHQIEDGREVKITYQTENSRQLEQNYLVYVVSVKCDVLHESGKITALTDDANGELLETELTVIDVTSGMIIVPPEEMEFRPKESHGHPSRENNMALYINPAIIPLGRKIKLEIEKARGSIGFIEKGQIVQGVSVTFEKKHIIPDMTVGRILIPWKGSGWGQYARITAETKKPDGLIARAEARILIEQREETGGMIKDVKYVPLENQKCSDLVDGIIYINSNHHLNRLVFGANKEEYGKMIEKDRTAQYRFSAVIVEQSVFRLAEDSYTRNQLIFRPDAPVTSLREFVDAKTHQLSPKVTKIFMIPIP